jgi:hypothetical protein
MRQINIDLYTENLLALTNAGDSAGGNLGSWLLLPDNNTAIKFYK